MSGVLVGVDIGGTKVATAVVDPGGRILGGATVPSRQPGVDVLDVIWSGIEKGVAASGRSWSEVIALGVGAPGPVDPESGLWWGSSNLPIPNPPMPLGEALRARANRPTFVENDVKAAGLGEFHFGHGALLKGSGDGLLFISIGTGLAASLLIGGSLLRGRRDAGEIGHIPVVPDGHPCGCGHRGCLETIASGRALLRWGREMLDAQWPTRLNALCGGDPASLQGDHIMQAAREGDSVALELVERLARGIALAILAGLRAYDPHLLVLGGGVIARGGPFLWQKIEEAFARLSPVYGRGRAVRASALGSEAGVLGAAAVGLHGLKYAKAGGSW